MIKVTANGAFRKLSQTRGTGSTFVSHTKRAFTLLELLVVIAVIAVLVALLAPALARAKVSARRVHCISQMKQWTMAFKQYTDDNQGWLPREGYHKGGVAFLNNWGQVYSPVSADVWYNCLSRYVGRPPASSYFWPAEHRLDFYRSASFFQCPSAKFPKEVLGQYYPYAYPFALFSVAMNSKLIDYPHIPTTKFNRIRRPSQTVLYLDGVIGDEELVFPTQSYDSHGQPAAYATRFAGKRHRSGNLSFADGHAETRKGEQVVSPDGWDIYPPVDIYWYLDD